MPRRKNNRRRTKEKKEVDVHVIDPQAPSGRGMHIKSLTAVYADSHFDETHAVEVESDSGNESPLVDITSAPCREHVLSYQCPESIKAWVSYKVTSQQGHSITASQLNKPFSMLIRKLCFFNSCFYDRF